MPTVRDIAEIIERFAPKSLQESYDNTGLQIGDPLSEVTAVLVCLDVTEDILAEAIERDCNMIISHHPLLFKGLKNITGATTTQRMVITALRNNIAIYSAHTNLDSTLDGVSYEMASQLRVRDLRTLAPHHDNPSAGLGVIGHIPPTPCLEFLRKVKEVFNVRALRYAGPASKLVIKNVALCGGSGASLIGDAIANHADILITGDIKYHDFTTWSSDILIADIGHYESELCATRILYRLVKDNCQGLPVHFAKRESNPVKFLI